MKYLKTFESLLLTPELQAIRDKNAKEIADQIKELCGKFLKESNGQMLYRGIPKDKYVKTTEIKKVRKNRTPMDTSDELTELADDMFEGKFGFRPRTQGVFTTGDKKVAESYGDPTVEPKYRRAFLFFPIGDYEFVWSNVVMDFYGDIEGGNITLSDQPEDERDGILEYYIGTYSDYDLHKAIKSRNEVVFICDEYLIVNHIYENDLLRLLY